MDKSLDYEMYEERSSVTSCLHHKKVLWARNLKLSFPESESAYGTMGSELLKSGQPQKSLIPLKRAITINYHDYSARKDFIMALFELGRENEAFCSIKKALSLDPMDYFLHQLLIETLEEKERLQDLEAFSKEILEKITDQEDRNIFYFYTAEALVSYNKYPQALVNFQKAFENNSPMKRYRHEAYGFALYHEGLFEEAIVQFEHIRKSDPNDKPACNNIAYLNYCIGKAEKALEGFEYIIENGLEISSTYANFILVLNHLDQDEETINQYKDLLQPSIISHGEELRRRYNEELRVTKAVLQKDNIDEKTKEFNVKKLEGITLLLSFFN